MDNNKISNEGALALAEALKTNTRLIELNLLGQPHQFGDACLEGFINMFHYNVTLTKIIWRLDSRKSFAINKLIVRNNTIAKWLSEGKDVSSLIPEHCNIRELNDVAGAEAARARAQSSAPQTTKKKEEEKKEKEEEEEEEEPEMNEEMNELEVIEEEREMIEEDKEMILESETESQNQIEFEIETPAELEPESETEDEKNFVTEHPEPQPEFESDPEEEKADFEETKEADVVIDNSPDVWFEICETPNGEISDEGRRLANNGRELGSKACISSGNVGFTKGIRDFAIINTGKSAVLVGVTFDSNYHRTDASKNKNRFVCAFFNGKIFGLTGGAQPFLAMEGEAIEEINVRLDLDEGKIYFAANGRDFDDENPAFQDLPKGVYYPYFSLGLECAITVV